MRELLAGHGIGLEAAAILDFGCGCGRVTRHWAKPVGPAIFGCDYNPELVGWCRGHLPSVRTELNGLEPPLPFDRRFDFIYAISVFTHLAEPLQFAWMNELGAFLNPGGALLFTTVGERGAARLTPVERERFDGGQLVVRFHESSGSNLCAAVHPGAFVRRMIGDLELLETVDSGLPGVWSASPLNRQDVHLVRLPAR
jgi:SAM-dependent methyltransferase